MNDSILTTIKKLLGIAEDYSEFDMDLLIHINTYFSVLHNVGAAPVSGFTITGATEKWSDFIADVKNIEMVKTYIYLRVRLIFDPPATSSVQDALKRTADELEWRLNTLELLFNEFAYSEDPSKVFVLEIDATDTFSNEAGIGDVGFDPESGEVWRRIS